MTNTVLNLTLRPVVGFRFQPTGFPDLGAATYQAHVSGEGWVQALHLESPQSMANRLELCTWDPAVSDQADALRGLPYVRVVDAGGGKKGIEAAVVRHFIVHLEDLLHDDLFGHIARVEAAIPLEAVEGDVEGQHAFVLNGVGDGVRV